MYKSEYERVEEWGNCERTIAVNFLGHFKLTEKLIGYMHKTSSLTQQNGRIIFLVSENHRLIQTSKLDSLNDVTLENFHSNPSLYNGLIAYATSKVFSFSFFPFFLNINEKTKKT